MTRLSVPKSALDDDVAAATVKKGKSKSKRTKRTKGSGNPAPIRKFSDLP